MKKKVFYMVNIVICLLAVFCISNTTRAEAKTVKVTAIKVTNIDYTNFYMMRVGGTLTIKTVILPKNATNKRITWSSSDETIAGVNDTGFVTGVNPGFCKITGVAKDGSNKKVSFYVRVCSEKEFIYAATWYYTAKGIDYTLRFSSTGEYTKYTHTDVDISDDEPSESGYYTLDTTNKTITMTQQNGKDQKVLHYTILSRSKLSLSDGTTQVTYTREYKRKGITCTSTGLLYMPSGTSGAYTYIVIGYKGTDPTITIPSKINKREVTWLNGMNGNTEIEQVIIPDSVTFIENWFENCTSLKSITIPDSINFIDYSAFENCVSLETVQLPADLKVISKYTFKGCTSLKSIKLPDQVASVDSEAFCNCTNLETVYFPKTIKEIEPDILKGCKQVVIYGYKGTCAEDFAKKNNLTFIER